MGRVSVKGVLIGGILDIFATFVLAIPLMAIVMVQLHFTDIPEAERTAALAKAIAPGSWYYLIGLGLGSLCSILAGYVAARIARHDELLNGAFSAWLCVLLGLYGWDSGTHATTIAAHGGWLVLSPILGALGGYIRLRSMSTNLPRIARRP
ncbi:MAG TPA: hypothetical protein VFL95_11050 [Gemmatimonadales bacterium]|nr:hypothetical protein [Gemmatimonadales bacterium]